MIQTLSTVKKGEMSASETLKVSLGLIFGMAADAAVTAALSTLIPVGRGWKRLLRTGGTFILAMMIGEKAEDYVCRTFDDVKHTLEETKKECAAEEAKEAKEDRPAADETTGE